MERVVRIQRESRNPTAGCWAKPKQVWRITSIRLEHWLSSFHTESQILALRRTPQSISLTNWWADLGEAATCLVRPLLPAVWGPGVRSIQGQVLRAGKSGAEWSGVGGGGLGRGATLSQLCLSLDGRVYFGSEVSEPLVTARLKLKLFSKHWLVIKATLLSPTAWLLYLSLNWFQLRRGTKEYCHGSPWDVNDW